MLKRFPKFRPFSPRGLRIPISVNLITNYLLIIALISLVFILVGIKLIGDRIIKEEQDQVRHDLNTAREIYLGELRHIMDVVELTASRFSLRDRLGTGDFAALSTELDEVRVSEGLDIFTLTNANGDVLLRSHNPQTPQTDLRADKLYEIVLRRKEPYAATQIVPAEELALESEGLADQALITLIDTPLARQSEQTEVRDGMMLRAAAPIFDQGGAFLGVLFGGTLVNRNYAIVDKIKATVYEDVTYLGKDIGTATIFQDDVRISTNVQSDDGTRAIGTRVSAEVYERVVIQGEPWIGRAFVVNQWFITAYEPIRDIYNNVIGILYVGVEEQKYIDTQNQTVLAFLAISLLGTLIAMVLSYFLSKRISEPIIKMAEAAQEIASGNLTAQVEPGANNELGDLAESFNAMAASLRQRDEQLKEFTKRKIMESERLAMIGQLSANVAHELNNPLQGIVTYAHLLLEEIPPQIETGNMSSSIERIVTQANRCRDIIRGLLDFSRQRKPDTTICYINNILRECTALVEKQASFQNIRIEERYLEDLPRMIIDPSQMQQVFLNMIINAAEAMEHGGLLRISTRLDSLNKFVVIEISDTGHGIPKELFDKLFDPFFTTKEVGHGTGLGLAISYGIIKEHNGWINVESTVGKGTTFTIGLPIVPEEVELNERV